VLIAVFNRGDWLDRPQYVSNRLLKEWRQTEIHRDLDHPTR